MAKIIKAKDFHSIWDTKPEYRKRDWMKKYEMAKTDAGFMFWVSIKPVVFALLYVPAVVATFFYCLWDGGLKEFELPKNYRSQNYNLWYFDKEVKICQQRIEKAEKIWERA